MDSFLGLLYLVIVAAVPFQSPLAMAVFLETTKDHSGISERKGPKGSFSVITTLLPFA